MRYKPEFRFGGSAKVTPEEVARGAQSLRGTPMFGYWWWYWIPAITHNGGRWSRSEVIDMSLYWLRWYVTLTLWPQKRQCNRKPCERLEDGYCARCHEAMY